MVNQRLSKLLEIVEVFNDPYKQIFDSYHAND